MKNRHILLNSLLFEVGIGNQPVKSNCMKLYPYLICLLCLSGGFAVEMQATHNRAGEIIVEQIEPCNDYMVRATIVTYTKTSSISADRDSLTICWGEGGNCETLYRSNGPGNNGLALENDIKRNEYIGMHVYPGPGTYTISMTDPNRNGGILNVNAPASDQVQFHIQTTHTLLNCQFNGINNSPILDYEPVDIGCIDEVFVHNPGAYDPDGDSLSFEIIQPLADINTPVPNYQFPHELNGTGTGTFSIDPVTGTLIWDSPVVAGEYNMAFIIISWRGGIALDTMIRDMQVTIRDCEDNEPPTIETIDEICVVAGDLLEFEVIADDPDAGQRVKLIARGGPFNVGVSPAEFEDATFFEVPPVAKTFRWQTECEHIAAQPYEVVFRATDNFFDTTGLHTLKIVKITVVGPPPENPEAVSVPGEIELYWDKPYACEDADNDYFYGFSVWRRENSNNFTPDNCETGLAGRGYTQVLALTEEMRDGRYFYRDTEVDRGKTYCYRILAKFARFTGGGNPFNLVESLPSDEVCAQLKQDVPLLTNVDVTETDTQNGEILIRWIPPKGDELDTLLNPGPYRYQLLRSPGIGTENFTPVPGAEWSADNFYQLTQTEYTDTGLNTLTQAYTYRLEFFVNGNTDPIRTANKASSVFLTVGGADERTELSWAYDTPWENYDFLVFKQQTDGQFTVLDTVQTPNYTEFGLVNGREYCYYIMTIGAYSVEGIPAPLFNNSQRACGVPIDTVPPCPPELSVRNICDSQISCQEAELINNLTWNNPNFACPETDDVIAYNVYYADREGAEFSLIHSTEDLSDTTFVHDPVRGLAGCYAVTAVDSFFNESLFSNIVCKDNCPQYELPNAFTPNDDGQNDVFVPYPYCFIDRIEMSIFNRWGQQVFTTTEPDINWTGQNMNGDNLSNGTYYYTCRVFEQRVSGEGDNERFLSGYIELLRE